MFLTEKVCILHIFKFIFWVNYRSNFVLIHFKLVIFVFYLLFYYKKIKFSRAGGTIRKNTQEKQTMFFFLHHRHSR